MNMRRIRRLGSAAVVLAATVIGTSSTAQALPRECGVLVGQEEYAWQMFDYYSALAAIFRDNFSTALSYELRADDWSKTATSLTNRAWALRC